MIKVGEKLVPCAEQIGRIVHISLPTAALERKVWFSDESRFLLQRADGRARVHRGRNSPTAFTSVMM